MKEAFNVLRTRLNAGSLRKGLKTYNWGGVSLTFTKGGNRNRNTERRSAKGGWRAWEVGSCALPPFAGGTSQWSQYIGEQEESKGICRAIERHEAIWELSEKSSQPIGGRFTCLAPG